MSARSVLQHAGAVFLTVAVAFPASAQTSRNVYIRADAGWSKSVDANFQDANCLADHVITGVGETKGVLGDYGGAWLLGGGVGVQFTPRFRGDLVYTYRGTYRLDAFDEAPLPANFRGNVSPNSV